MDPYFIKIDVENFESEVLHGGMKTIEKSKPIILIESLDEKCQSIMNTLGYEFFNLKMLDLFESSPHYNTFCFTS